MLGCTGILCCLAKRANHRSHLHEKEFEINRNRIDVTKEMNEKQIIVAQPKQHVPLNDDSFVGAQRDDEFGPEAGDRSIDMSRSHSRIYAEDHDRPVPHQEPSKMMMARSGPGGPPPVQTRENQPDTAMAKAFQDDDAGYVQAGEDVIVNVPMRESHKLAPSRAQQRRNVNSNSGELSFDNLFRKRKRKRSMTCWVILRNLFRGFTHEVFI